MKPNPFESENNESKDQLRGEIATLEFECKGLKQKLKGIERLHACSYVAFVNTMKMAHLAAKSRMGKADTYDTLADIVTNYFAELTRLTELDFTQEPELEHIDKFCTNMGFDQITTTVIKERIPKYLQILERAYEGKSKDNNESQ